MSDTFDYSEIQETASELLAEFKQGTIKLVKLTDGTGPSYDPGDPTETKYTLDATAKAAGEKYQSSALIEVTDILVTAAVHADATPEMKDRIEIDGVQHEIIDIKRIPPAGTPVVNKIFVRK